MSTPIDDGGSAFPTTESHESINFPGQRDVYASAGMTLRDYFAGQALAGLLAGEWPGKAWKDGGVSKESYEIADAMLAARKATP